MASSNGEDLSRLISRLRHNDMLMVEYDRDEYAKFNVLIKAARGKVDGFEKLGQHFTLQDMLDAAITHQYKVSGDPVRTTPARSDWAGLQPRFIEHDFWLLKKSRKLARIEHDDFSTRARFEHDYF